MAKQSKSKVNGESSAEAERQRSVSPCSSEELRSSTSDMSESSPTPKSSQIGFQPTPAFGEIDEVSANVQVITAFAARLGARVEWKRLALSDGQEVIALCFPLEHWVISDTGTLSVKRYEEA